MATPATRTCRGYSRGGIAPHDEPDDAAHFGPGRTQCRSCYAAYLVDWKAGRSGRRPTARRAAEKAAADFGGLDLGGSASAEDAEYVTDDDLQSSRSHAYRPDPALVSLWHAIASDAARGSHPANLFFVGPSGCGKTDGAQYLAGLVGLPFTKVDAASMTDPESWFGTREVVVQDGVSVTSYRPSTFVDAIQRPGVLLIDEATRIRDEHRNVLLPLLDGTHRVTNPLTGDVVVKDPRCFVILSGNRGLQFTGTYAVDPAMWTRALVVPFDYAAEADEVAIATEASGCDEPTAALLVRFAGETRGRAKADPDMMPMSTREIIAAARLAASGLDVGLAVGYTTINGASDEGGASSVRAQLELLWGGIYDGGAGRHAACSACGLSRVAHDALGASADHPWTL